MMRAMGFGVPWRARPSSRAAVWLTCGAQAVVQQLGGQEARGAGGAGGQTRRRPALCCPRARWRNAGGVEQPEGVLPLSAELVGGSRARAEEVFEEGHVAPLAILLLRS